jgi:hypothetical protein
MFGVGFWSVRMNQNSAPEPIAVPLTSRRFHLNPGELVYPCRLHSAARTGATCSAE